MPILNEVNTILAKESLQYLRIKIFIFLLKSSEYLLTYGSGSGNSEVGISSMLTFVKKISFNLLI